MWTRRLFVPTAALALAIAACSEAPVGPDADVAPQLAKTSAGADAAAELGSYMDALNAALTAEGAGYLVAKAEYITSGDGDAAGAEVLQKDVGNKQLGADFVPGDTRRAWSSVDGNAITYAVDQTGDAVPVFGGLGAAETDAAIVRAMDTWDGVTCSNLGLSRNDDFGVDIGVLAFLNGLGGSPFVVADVQHAGWRDINFAGGILGVTFTFVFVDGNGPTDIDGNGKSDTAFREIYYDPSFTWADDGSTNVDVETVALHEAGHGLSQAHFGNIFIKKGALAASPRAVMNAFYGGPLRSLLGTDNGGHCSNWGEWPNN